MQNKINGSGPTILLIPKKEMEDIMKIVKSSEESRLLMKRINETITNKAIEQKDRFFPVLLGTLAASILGNEITRVAEGLIRAGQNFQCDLILKLILKLKNINKRNLHLMVSIQKNYLICLNLSKIKDGAYIINLDECESIETHWIALYVSA